MTSYELQLRIQRLKMPKNYSMKVFVMLIICFVSFTAFTQEETKDEEVFLPIVIEGKEAFISTRTGEHIFRSHEKTNPLAIITTPSGVVYTDTIIHTVLAKESLFSIAKKYDLSISELKKQNNLSKDNLDIGQDLKIVKHLLVKSSSPVISYAGEERIIARLSPGQSPPNLNPPDVVPGSVNQNIADLSFNEEQEKKERIEEDAVSDVESVHVVKSGETLFGLAKKYKMTIEKLKGLNNLTFNNLSVGQKLKLQ